MKQLLFSSILSCTSLLAVAQDSASMINAKEAERIEKTLSSDALRGRKVFTPDIEKAAAFIAGEFKGAGLVPLEKSGSYLQDFSLVQTHFISAEARLDMDQIPAINIVTFTSNPDLVVTQDSGYIKVHIRTVEDLSAAAIRYIQSDKSYLVLVDTSLALQLRRIQPARRPRFKSERSTIFILYAKDPQTWHIEIKHEVTRSKLTNVVGVLPGKSMKDQYVIFSAHYDHLGVGKPNSAGDSIYNGANDDASGCTAVILLAKYFKQLNTNERTIVFVTFTAEEIGGYGSQYFSRQFDPEKVVGMFNIEMIGTESKWGANSAYITGYEKTDMGKILEKNLQGSKFEFHPDPYAPQNLFYRSDNATLARLGVPAHTLSTSKMEEPPNDEPNYHKPSDEIGTLDMKNMAEIIRAIAISSNSIVTGTDTPTRVDTKNLR